MLGIAQGRASAAAGAAAQTQLRAGWRTLLLRCVRQHLDSQLRRRVPNAEGDTEGNRLVATSHRQGAAGVDRLMRYVLRISCVLQGTLDAVASGTITIALKLYSLPEAGCCNFLCVPTALGPQHACRVIKATCMLTVRIPSPRHGLAWPMVASSLLPIS